MPRDPPKVSHPKAEKTPTGNEGGRQVLEVPLKFPAILASLLHFDLGFPQLGEHFKAEDFNSQHS